MPTHTLPTVEPQPQSLTFDVFCHVIDNFGDVGVCWRLVRQLAALGHHCRLWLDDASALQWMAPDVAANGQARAGISVLPWRLASEPDAPKPGDVVIEAFGCEIPEPFVARFHRPRPPVWVNLEYFSAEDYVERSHALPSPIMSGAGKGLTRHFFFPGVTELTGGLLRAPHGLASDAERARLLKRCGLSALTPEPGDRLMSVFCYAHAPLREWLNALERSRCGTWHVLLTPGHAQQLAREASGLTNRFQHVKLWPLPALPQEQFDALLDVCDLNVVRGEDSAVRALWAGRPHVWHIYHQDDGAHGPKLDAFADHWLADWPDNLASQVRGLWRAFNSLPGAGTLETIDMTLLLGGHWSQWQACSRLSSEKQARQSDLVSRLLAMVAKLSP